MLGMRSKEMPDEVGAYEARTAGNQYLHGFTLYDKAGRFFARV
jgi:hypothetical protein